MIELFVFYVSSILVSGATLQKFLDILFLFLPRENLGLGPEENKFFTLKKTWKTPGILSSLVIEHLVFTYID